MIENLFLDDVRQPEDVVEYKPEMKHYYSGKLDWFIVRNFNEFTEYITSYYNENKKLPKFISFDHDLSLEHYAPKEFWDEKYNDWAETQEFKEKTGFDCAKWLSSFCKEKNIKLPKFLVHSKNTAGARNIYMYLLNHMLDEEN